MAVVLHSWFGGVVESCGHAADLLMKNEREGQTTQKMIDLSEG